MSYILDALKKADAEREQGAVPGLHSRPQAPAPEDDDSDEKPGRTLPIVWLGAGAALCLIAVLSWQLLRRDPAPPEALVAVAPSPAVQEAAPLPSGGQQAVPPASPQMPQTMAPPQQVPPAAVPMPAAPAPPPPVVSAPPRQEPTAVAPPLSSAAPPPVSPGAAQQDTAKVASAMPPTVAAPRAPGAANQQGQRIPGIQELPEDVRREIPQLTIGGAMYSEIPTQRMLIVNSQVFREGDQPYQGLMLEEIRLKSAVFKYRGYRYSINY
jgi:general secretion pathway protein B